MYLLVIIYKFYCCELINPHKVPKCLMPTKHSSNTVLDIQCGCGFLFVRYKRQFCIKVGQLGARSFPLFGIKDRLWEVDSIDFNPCLVSFIEMLSSSGKVSYGRFHCAVNLELLFTRFLI